MSTTDWANLARCANERMEILWDEACATVKWKPAHERRWREHETYTAMQRQALREWRLSDPRNA